MMTKRPIHELRKLYMKQGGLMLAHEFESNPDKRKGQPAMISKYWIWTFGGKNRDQQRLSITDPQEVEKNIETFRTLYSETN